MIHNALMILFVCLFRVYMSKTDLLQGFIE